MMQETTISGQISEIISEKSTELLRVSSIPANLWPEAFQHAIWLKNRSPARALRKKDKKTPWEALYGQQPSLDRERIWGSRAYCAYPVEKRAAAAMTKLHHPRGWIGYFVGCESESMYHIYDPEKHSVRRKGMSEIDDGEGLDDPQDRPSLQDINPVSELGSQELHPASDGDDGSDADTESLTDDDAPAQLTRSRYFAAAATKRKRLVVDSEDEDDAAPPPRRSGPRNPADVVIISDDDPSEVSADTSNDEDTDNANSATLPANAVLVPQTQPQPEPDVDGHREPSLPVVDSSPAGSDVHNDMPFSHSIHWVPHNHQAQVRVPDPSKPIGQPSLSPNEYLANKKENRRLSTLQALGRSAGEDHDTVPPVHPANVARFKDTVSQFAHHGPTNSSRSSTVAAAKHKKPQPRHDDTSSPDESDAHRVTSKYF
jgi:hypothetical protein